MPAHQTSLASLALLLLASSLQAQNPADIQIQARHVAGSVHMLTGGGGNIGVLVGDDGVLLVDDQFAPLADKIKAALGELGDGGLRFVLNTHWHEDHTHGNRAFGLEAPIVAHTNVRARLEAGAFVLGRDVAPYPPEALPVLTFEDSVSFHMNGEEVRAVHYPHGHTDGDAVVYFLGSNVVHMGDDYFNGMFPFVDIGNGGSVQGLAENIAVVLDRIPADAKVIPGHGGLSDVAGLRVYHEMLMESLALVAEARAAGKSLEEIQAAGMPERWAHWGAGFINTGHWLAIVHGSLDAGEAEG